MKSFWSVDLPEFLKSDNSLKNSSMVNNLTLVLTLMRLFAMVLLFKVVSFADKTVELVILSLLMLLLFHSVLKLSVVL